MTASSPSPSATFAEMRAVLARLPGPDEAARAKVRLRQADLTKPPGSLGRLEEITEWLAAWQGSSEPRCRRPRVCVFAGSHGVVARGVSAYPADVNTQMVQNFVAGGAAINQLTAAIDGDLRVYEMDLAHPVGDFTQGPAMDEARCARAMAYGMMAAETGIDVLCLGEMGIGNTTSAAALCLALLGGQAEDWVGPGTGVAGAALERKIETVRLGVERHRTVLEDPLLVLAALGGEELAAICGAILAARMGRIPVLLDGYASTAAAAVLQALDPHALDHCLVAHRSAEPAHAALCARLGQKPLLDLGMRLGEASGAALAVSLLKAACACLDGMATFNRAGVSGPV
ncbi:nicotinate-nucleotide--dimethylbenzimidazole phosphoribosyltransferase [Vineibacter terrae]|uniref:nicotinate-nucleotide--dimethylbenzimidazole phosphoribosyltransferase n=1 Tax=Vineibacter terrae TaxID=2586908 RepID=UPI002E345326|nr:nicotinate-nucleotide--dimethylbenzimidazole phosphoribosyltransferase [Vineibacter terrae]HEX2892162.1 nicotinate-nucleotide--dimethylbenzimidazole phosphoribosyltransferase [Vineibacter terrae]